MEIEIDLEVSTMKKVNPLKGFSTIIYKPKVFELSQNCPQNYAQA